MIRQNRRFPRAVLFARAAEMQSQLEYWAGETALSHQQAEDSRLGETVVQRLQNRYERLQVCRALATELRSHLFDIE